MKTIIPYIVTGTVLTTIDLIWLGLYMMKPFFSVVKDIQGTDVRVNPIAAAIAWTLLSFGTTYFGTLQLTNYSISNAVKTAGLFGLICYGVFDFTNLAIFSKYSLRVAIIDTLWGAVLCTVSALISRHILDTYFS